MRRIAIAIATSLLLACASNEWVLKDPPRTCALMCQKWGMDLAAVVGVGEQSREKDASGATACVCRPHVEAAPVAPSAAGATPTAPPVSELDPAIYEAAGYAAIPPEIRQREAAAAQARQTTQSRPPAPSYRR